MKIEAGFNEKDGLFLSLEPSNSEEYREMEKLVERIKVLNEDRWSLAHDPYIENRIATIPLGQHKFAEEDEE